MMSLSCPGSAAVAVNTPFDLRRFGRSPMADEVGTAFGMSWPDMIELHEDRLSVLPQLRAAARGQRLPRILVVQNDADDWHMVNSYRPFCEMFKVPPAGGYDPSRRILAWKYDDPSGHAPEPEELLPQIVAALDELLAEP
jgi:hypothetical protein